MTRRSCQFRHCLFVIVVATIARESIQAQHPIRFLDVTKDTGLFLPLQGLMGHGGAWGDVDNDGDVDLFVGGFCDRPTEAYHPAKGPVTSRLFINNGRGKFSRQAASDTECLARTSGAVFVDLNNDGLPELYVANNTKGFSRLPDGPRKNAQLQRSILLENIDGRLANISEHSGACPPTLRTARNIGVLDFDQDGLLDLFLVEDRFVKSPRSMLLKNLGELKFRDATAEAGIPDDVFGLGFATADVNEDGFPDFFVPHSNRMFLSNGKGRFHESAELNRIFAWSPVNPRDKEDWPCGAAFGDLNRDGRLDLVLSIHHERARNRVYINEGLRNGVPQFRDVTQVVGIPHEISNKSPHVEVQDFDNDGWLDIYFSTARLDQAGEITPLIFRNEGLHKGLPRFRSIADVAKDESLVYFPAGPSADFNRDGRLDLFLINWFSGNHCRLLSNESTRQHWLDVTVVGRSFNRMGIGAKVSVFATDSDTQLIGYQEVATGYGYASGQEARCHFGLGAIDRVNVTIVTPNGKTMKFNDIDVDRHLIATEP